MAGEGGAVIALLIGHIAISKSFGRVRNYTIDPSQGLVAIGVTNLLRPFLEGYLATASFSRTAISTAGDVEPGQGAGAERHGASAYLRSSNALELILDLYQNTGRVHALLPESWLESL
ncbi:hypothetical protein N7535_005708 [Penicillium sp. DV-2018c]|nr:hypothetical protein N7461_009283 [Penicillium sp. DV-2018c]KAJ5572048.1 hypothetical protein N7535_005708 [Penicillium sp. DV-2018c]